MGMFDTPDRDLIISDLVERVHVGTYPESPMDRELTQRLYEIRPDEMSEFIIHQTLSEIRGHAIFVSTIPSLPTMIPNGLYYMGISYKFETDEGFTYCHVDIYTKTENDGNVFYKNAMESNKYSQEPTKFLLCP